MSICVCARVNGKCIDEKLLEKVMVEFFHPKNSFTKEVYGMPFDKAFYEFYESAVAEIETDIKVMFGEDMEQLVKSCDSFKTRGLFSLSYKYIPLNYIITIENEFREFNIVIEDEEGASTCLGGIKDYDSNLRKSSIKNAIILLKTILQENNFNFYFTKGDKLYRKNKEGIKRIKDKDIRKDFFSND